MNILQDKVALVTGYESGIGLATAMYLVEKGATVIVANIDKKALAKLGKRRDNEDVTYCISV